MSVWRAVRSKLSDLPENAEIPQGLSSAADTSFMFEIDRYAESVEYICSLAIFRVFSTLPSLNLDGSIKLNCEVFCQAHHCCMNL